MSISPEGLLVCAALLFLSRYVGSPLFIGLFASLPFGATAFFNIGGLGGSSILIYCVFSLAFLASIALRKSFLRDLGIVFRHGRLAVLLLSLSIYVLISAAIFPRLFAGQTHAFVPIMGVVTEVQLGPVSGNITQTAYLILGVLIFFAVRIELLNPSRFVTVARAFLTLAALQAALGMIDLGAKLAGLGDVLAPIRTANYALLSDVEEQGFFRIAGGHPEASAFGTMSLMCLGFCYRYWKLTGSALALALGLVLLLLTVLSTSSTAYVGLAVLIVFPIKSLIFTLMQVRFSRQLAIIYALMIIPVCVSIAIYLYDFKIMAPVTNLLDAVIIHKQNSNSGVERLYWNTVSLQGFADTGGVGLGMGSSRASSWPVAVLSQLGIIGALAFLVLTLTIVFGVGRRSASNVGGAYAAASSARAGALALLCAGTLTGGSADPGLIYFIALAVILAARRHGVLARTLYFGRFLGANQSSPATRTWGDAT